ncbi:hypothetical protein X975_02908, partial [Stegodyphus mimosarum]
MNSPPVVPSKISESVSDTESDPKPMVPLRQRRLPASFWQEPCIAPSASHQDIAHQIPGMSSNQTAPGSSLHPWTMNTTNAVFPTFMSQRLSVPNALVLAQNTSPFWLRSPFSCCGCATCLNYSYAIPRIPDVYGNLRYRQPVNIPCCPSLNSVDQSCKLCCTSDSWHPERLRQLRLRSARYNALID